MRCQYPRLKIEWKEKIVNGCESFITNPVGLQYFCTLGAGHTGSHVAGMTGGGVAAVWLEPEPSRQAVSR